MPDNYKSLNLDWIEVIIRFVFSWIILMPISVIITGKLLAKPIKFSVTSKQVFQIPLRILIIQATGGEVVLGFTGFIITLFILGVADGPDAYALVKTNFGIDPGQFNSLCMLSSFITVAWSFALFLLHSVFSGTGASSFIKDKVRYDAQIQHLTAKKEDN